MKDTNNRKPPAQLAIVRAEQKRIFMKVTAQLIIITTLYGCNYDGSQKDPEESEANIWHQLDEFNGHLSATFSSTTFQESESASLLIQGNTTISTIDDGNIVNHYWGTYLSTNRDFPNVSNNKFLASIGDDPYGVTFTKHTTGWPPIKTGYMHENTHYYPDTLFRSAEWVKNHSKEGRIASPNNRGAKKGFGIFNKLDTFLTVVNNSQRCIAVIYTPEFRIETHDYETHTYYFDYETYPIELFEGDINNCEFVNYATNGKDFFINVHSNNGALKITSTGEVTKIFDSRVTNLFYHSNGDLLLQSDYDLYISSDDGNSWSTLWSNTPSSALSFFSIEDNLFYYTSHNEIIRVDYDTPKKEWIKLNNTGLSNIKSAITSITEFNDNVYITTSGEGVFYKSLANFNSPELLEPATRPSEYIHHKKL